MKINNTKVLIRLRAYNNEKSIERAIKSVINQTYGDFCFIIIISTGSNDNTMKICEKFAAEDKRIFIVNSNQNFVYNWIEDVFIDNLGKSQYFCSLDADDEYNSGFLEQTIAFIEENNLDMVRVCTQITDENDKTILNREHLTENLIVEKKDFGLLFPEYIRYCQTWWGMLIKSSILKKIKPDEWFGLSAMAFNNYCVDSIQMQCVLKHINRFAILKNRLHVQYIRNESYSTHYAEFRIYSNYLLSDCFRKYLLEVTGGVSEENENYIRFALVRRLINSFNLFIKSCNIDDHQRMFYIFQHLKDTRFNECIESCKRHYPDVIGELLQILISYSDRLNTIKNTQLYEEKHIMLKLINEIAEDSNIND